MMSVSKNRSHLPAVFEIHARPSDWKAAMPLTLPPVCTFRRGLAHPGLRKETCWYHAWPCPNPRVRHSLQPRASAHHPHRGPRCRTSLSFTSLSTPLSNIMNHSWPSFNLRKSACLGGHGTHWGHCCSDKGMSRQPQDQLTFFQFFLSNFPNLTSPSVSVIL